MIEGVRHGIDYTENILFNFNINTGLINNPGNDKGNNAQLLGGGSQKVDRGRVLTLTEVIPTFAGLGDSFTLTVNNKSITYTVVNDPRFASFDDQVVFGLTNLWNQAALSRSRSGTPPSPARAAASAPARVC